MKEFKVVYGNPPCFEYPAGRYEFLTIEDAEEFLANLDHDIQGYVEWTCPECGANAANTCICYGWKR